MTQRQQQAKHIIKLIEDGGCEDEINARVWCLDKNHQFHSVVYLRDEKDKPTGKCRVIDKINAGYIEYYTYCKYTTSLDALLEIVPEGWACELRFDAKRTFFEGCTRHYLTRFDVQYVSNKSLCDALLHCIMQIIARGYDE